MVRELINFFVSNAVRDPVDFLLLGSSLMLTLSALFILGEQIVFEMKEWSSAVSFCIDFFSTFSGVAVMREILSPIIGDCGVISLKEEVGGESLVTQVGEESLVTVSTKTGFSLTRGDSLPGAPYLLLFLIEFLRRDLA